MMQYSDNSMEADIARVRAILDRATDALSLDDTDALFEDASLLLELEPTPIGPNGVHASSSTIDLEKQVIHSMDSSTFDSRVRDVPCSNAATTKMNLSDSPVALASSMMLSLVPSHDDISIKASCPRDTSDATNLTSMTRPTKRRRLCTDTAMMRPLTPAVSMGIPVTSQGENRDEDSQEGSTGGAASTRFRPYQADQWVERFQDLVDFKSKHGNCLVPHNFPENQQLAQWVKRQRYQYKLKILGRHSTLTDVRQTELEEIGFVWDSHMAVWYERLESLKEFRLRYGHSNVPSNYDQDRPLAVWVKCQRRQMRLFKNGFKSTMNHYRFVALDQLDFDWNPRNI